MGLRFNPPQRDRTDHTFRGDTRDISVQMGKMMSCLKIAVIALCVFIGSVAAAPVGIIDELNGSTGWWIEQRDPSYGKVEFSNGTIVIFRNATATINDVAIHKTYRFPFRDNTWIHVLVRQPQGARLGADMYTDIYLNETKIAEFNVNGEEHWFNQNGQCTAKVLDDSFHIGLAADNRNYLENVSNSLTWTNDVPVSYPPRVQIAYWQWTLYSVQYHVAQDGVARWRFLVDGNEIVYRDIGYRAPEGQFQNVATVRPIDGGNDVSFRLAVLGDGDLYKKGNGYAGAEQRQCFSDLSPFWVDANHTAHPDTARIEWDLLMIGNAHHGDYDLHTIKSLIYAGKVSTSTAILTDMISWQDAQFNCPYVSHDEIRRVHRRKPRKPEALDFCLERVKNDIYAGSIGTADAVLTDLISWQNAQFNCPYMSEDEKNKVKISSKGSQEFCTQ